ncbi:hypothetical protein SETIT_2G120300v2 [Setaria italica]|nr:uncharacterized protein LOC101778712 [Setaria italica]RCV10547.1 hypothetical protein SETIT_2G120300v2 [Setaria italica]
MADTEFRRQLCGDVSSSVVMVEKPTGPSSQFCVGCVIHKTTIDTYILTRTEFIPRKCKLVVHFSDGTKQEAKRLVGDKQFTVIHSSNAHASSTAIWFRHEPIDYSELLCIVPKPPASFQRFWDRIARPSCASTRDDGTLVPDRYFLYICHHDNTKLMTTAPIFHKDGGVCGFVLDDCMTTDKTGEKVDAHVKFCVKATTVENKLRTMLKNDDWKRALEDKAK